MYETITIPPITGHDLSQESVESFKEAHFKVTGEMIQDNEARVIAVRLYNFIALIIS